MAYKFKKLNNLSMLRHSLARLTQKSEIKVTATIFSLPSLITRCF